jgi:hypothetical protein
LCDAATNKGNNDDFDPQNRSILDGMRESKASSRENIHILRETKPFLRETWKFWRETRLKTRERVIKSKNTYRKSFLRTLRRILSQKSMLSFHLWPYKHPYFDSCDVTVFLSGFHFTLDRENVMKKGASGILSRSTSSFTSFY